MEEYIKTDSAEFDIVDYTARPYGEKKLLANDISGVTTRRIFIKKGTKHTANPYKNKTRVILFIKGTGVVTISSKRYRIEEMAIFCPSLETAFTIEAKSSTIEYLEILTDMTPAESTDKHKINEKLPYFANYFDCKQYTEKIKSDKTINRTILPPDIIPRLIIGSVETVGPDTVETHKHPMLEQLFYGLPGNHCRVKADEQQTIFEENVLLHIPLGSTHGVRVEPGSKLHYLWMDFFKRQQDMPYITDSHIPVDANDSTDK